MKKLQLKFSKLMSGRFFGYFRSLIKGSGLEIEDIRPYEYGDDIRNINWKLTAKYGKIFVNLFREEKESQFHIFLDINYNWKGGKSISNLDIIIEFLSDLGVFVRRYGGEIVLRKYDINKKRIVPFKIGRDLLTLYGFLKNLEKDLNKIRYGYYTYISEFLKLQKSIVKRRHIFIISDFLGITQEEVKYINVFREKNEIYLFKIYVGDIGKNYTGFDVKVDDGCLDRLKDILYQFN